MNRTIALLLASAACATWAKPLQIVTEQNPPFNYQEGKDIKGTSTEAVRALLAKAGVEGKFALMKWNEAYERAQRNANTCIYSTSRVENREKIFKWYGPIARDVWARIRPHFMSTYDETQAIGRRYRRQDEIGTPLCVTVDFESIDDRAVTIRERDSMSQVRVAIDELIPALREKLGA